MARFPVIVALVVALALPAAIAGAAASPDPRLRDDSVSTGGSTPVAVAVGDVNGDGRHDLIVATAGGGADPATDHTISVFEQSEGGALPAAPSQTLMPSAAADAYMLAIGDLDHDGDSDLAVGVKGVGIDLFMQDAGELALLDSMEPIPVQDVAVADLNGDTWDDVVFVRNGSAPFEMRRRLQQADGSFAAGEVIEADAPATQIVTGDSNSDGLIDLALSGSLSTVVPVYEQVPADHTFSRTDVSLDAPVTQVLLMDVNANGRDDLVVREAASIAWSPSTAGGFGAFERIDAEASDALEMIDANGDGLLDIASLDDDSVSVYRQRSAGGLGAACSFPGHPTGDPLASAVGDISGDGSADLASADPSTATGTVWLYRQLVGDDLLDTGLTLTTDASELPYGKRVRLRGSLTSPEGGCLRTEVVEITRTRIGGTPRVIGIVPLADDGSYRYSDTPPTTGRFAYDAVWAGDGTHDAAASPTRTLRVTKLDTSLSLQLTRGTVTYGGATTLEAKLTGGLSSSEVLFAKLVKGTPRVVGAERVGDDHVARLKVEPARRTTYVAIFEPTQLHQPSTSPQRTVKVRAVMKGEMVNFLTLDGKLAVFACCRAFYRYWAVPTHPGGPTTVVAEYYDNGDWHFLTKYVHKLKDNGKNTIFVNVSGGRGYRFRIRARFDGDADHLANWSGYSYFRFS